MSRILNTVKKERKTRNSAGNPVVPLHLRIQSNYLNKGEGDRTVDIVEKGSVADPHHFGKPDTESHQCEKPDPHSHQSEKPNLNQQKSENLGAVKVQNGATRTMEDR